MTFDSISQELAPKLMTTTDSVHQVDGRITLEINSGPLAPLYIPTGLYVQNIDHYQFYFYILHLNVFDCVVHEWKLKVSNLHLLTLFFFT